ncbi:hypothetical protein LINGRAHAP2_LOCUS18953, partial [Linum grandiflorum]
NSEHQHTNLAARFRSLLRRDWRINLKHIYRETNHAAECLENLGHRLALRCREMPLGDNELRRWLVYDEVGETEF